MEKKSGQTKYPSGMDRERYEAVIGYVNQIVKRSVTKNDESRKASDLETRVSK